MMLFILKRLYFTFGFNVLKKRRKNNEEEDDNSDDDDVEEGKFSTEAFHHVMADGYDVGQCLRLPNYFKLDNPYPGEPLFMKL